MKEGTINNLKIIIDRPELLFDISQDGNSIKPLNLSLEDYLEAFKNNKHITIEYLLFFALFTNISKEKQILLLKNKIKQKKKLYGENAIDTLDKITLLNAMSHECITFVWMKTEEGLVFWSETINKVRRILYEKNFFETALEYYNRKKSKKDE